MKADSEIQTIKFKRLTDSSLTRRIFVAVIRKT